ncbi:hypothetical protein R7P80_02375 [Vibrio sp. 2092]|uniref:hypothetical protein n=1 Tax=Vibrio TaxID=662 RepID=UPI0006572F3F|nr:MULTISPECIES: hypothetical protein [Vibrio]AKO77502.1 hypothetical protein EN12_20235 [Vibrio cholerae]MCA2471627.1 hypothetical protein [Vibrio alginolyticus]MDW2151647.1 hypothetical protein [Vibrio sp. 2092]
MAKHKKYKMLLAKADNMDLVILLKYESQYTWVKSPNSYPPNNDYTIGFLCLPKHEVACLSALNGSKIQIREGEGDWVEVELDSKWKKTEWYMSEHFDSRIAN